ncbi:MAG: ornithine cyclodeaminase family protein [Deltaproteobacteria bacterium]|nr:ornithine cyclodeaminase family protein [Deltaproteobacteria bacterium]MCZ6549602.1 ornithine cyclodeaminase family protein [Deltaproteobacteria bacterium]MCZ6561339.1 ornithine cyclodeaminase family protein [Deltaproteobacteria bacterium]
MILLLGPDDMKGLITMKEAVDAMEQGLRDWADNPELAALRRRVHAPSGARVTVHQGAPASAGVTGILTHCEQVVIHPSGIQTYAVRGRPVRVIYSANNSELLAITIGEVRVKELPEANNVVNVQTACATAVGVKWLARKNSRRIGVLGSRGQARCQLLACKAVLPTLEEARVYSPTSENRTRFAEEMTELLDMEVQAVGSARQAIQGADVLITVTNSNVPTFDGNWLEPGVHLCSIVSSNIGLMHGGFVRQKRREVDDTTLRRAEIIVCNSKDQERLDEPGVLWDPIQQGVITWEKVWDLGELLSGKVPGRTDDQQISFFKNNAFWGVGDQVIGALLYRRALERGIGTRLPIDPAEYRE